MCFTVHIIFINFEKLSPNLRRETRDTCLAPECFERSIRGPWPKKVVHHWFTRTRPHFWVSQINIDRVASEGYHLVTKPTFSTRSDNTVFGFLLSLSDMTLIH